MIPYEKKEQPKKIENWSSEDIFATDSENCQMEHENLKSVFWCRFTADAISRTRKNPTFIKKIISDEKNYFVWIRSQGSPSFKIWNRNEERRNSQSPIGFEPATSRLQSVAQVHYTFTDCHNHATWKLSHLIVNNKSHFPSDFVYNVVEFMKLNDQNVASIVLEIESFTVPLY